MLYKTSIDKISWSNPAIVKASRDGRDFSVGFDGTYMHYAECVLTAGGTIYYRRGTPNTNGSITWSAGEQTVLGEGAPVTYGYPNISVDSGGYPWIGYLRNIGAWLYWNAWVIKSSTNDGTWTTQAAFPRQFTDAPVAITYASLPSIVPLTDEKVYVVWGGGNVDGYSGPVKGSLWDGAAWGSEETASTSWIAHYPDYCVVGEGNDVHLVFLAENPFNIVYLKRSYGVGWGSEVIIQPSTTWSSSPVLSIDDDNNLYVFWGKSPIADHIFYRKFENGAWKAGVKWINESVETLTYGIGITGFYKEYGNYIGLAYMTKTASPYNIKFNHITLPPDPAATPEPAPVVNTLISSGSRHTAGPEEGSTGTKQSFKRSRIVRHITWVPVVVVRA